MGCTSLFSRSIVDGGLPTLFRFPSLCLLSFLGLGLFFVFNPNEHFSLSLGLLVATEWACVCVGCWGRRWVGDRISRLPPASCIFTVVMFSAQACGNNIFKAASSFVSAFVSWKSFALMKDQRTTNANYWMDSIGCCRHARAIKKTSFVTSLDSNFDLDVIMAVFILDHLHPRSLKTFSHSANRIGCNIFDNVPQYQYVNCLRGNEGLPSSSCDQPCNSWLKNGLLSSSQPWHWW